MGPINYLVFLRCLLHKQKDVDKPRQYENFFWKYVGNAGNRTRTIALGGMEVCKKLEKTKTIDFCVEIVKTPWLVKSLLLKQEQSPHSE